MINLYDMLEANKSREISGVEDLHILWKRKEN